MLKRSPGVKPCFAQEAPKARLGAVAQKRDSCLAGLEYVYRMSTGIRGAHRHEYIRAYLHGGVTIGLQPADGFGVRMAHHKLHLALLHQASQRSSTSDSSWMVPVMV